jgi:hypothetical protein
MMLSSLGDLGDFIGGIGVIVTLIYLAIQIRRNTVAVHSASLDSAYAAHMEFQRTVWTDPDLCSFWHEGLGGKEFDSPEERRRFSFMLNTCLRLWESAYFKAQYGQLHSKPWIGLNRELTFVFSTPGAQKNWKGIRSICSSEFSDYVQAETASAKERVQST